ncbi:hypothetical protein PN824_003700, partial [Morganella morganii]|nr:hypothetical protein [Morganella morganii]
AKIYFAFQQEIFINTEIRIEKAGEEVLIKNLIGGIIPRTFEDALITENLLLISALTEKIKVLPTTNKSQIKKILNDLDESKTLQEFMRFLHSRLNPDCEDTKIKGKGEITKAALAVELLFICDNGVSLSVPTYIKNGLEWLQDNLNQSNSIHHGVNNE